MDLVDLFIFFPYLRLPEVDALACSSTRVADVAAARQAVALRLWATLMEWIEEAFMTWDREAARRLWEDSNELGDDDDYARLFLDLFSRLFSVRIFHANYRSAQLCETTAKISSSP